MIPGHENSHMSREVQLSRRQLLGVSAVAAVAAGVGLIATQLLKSEAQSAVDTLCDLPADKFADIVRELQDEIEKRTLLGQLRTGLHALPEIAGSMPATIETPRDPSKEGGFLGSILGFEFEGGYLDPWGDKIEVVMPPLPDVLRFFSQGVPIKLMCALHEETHWIHDNYNPEEQFCDLWVQYGMQKFSGKQPFSCHREIDPASGEVLIVPRNDFTSFVIQYGVRYRSEEFSTRLFDTAGVLNRDYL